MNPEENNISSDLSDPMIEELKKIFEAHQVRESKPFFDKWPARIAGIAVRGFLPSAGVSLFRPYDPMMQPTLGATFVAQD